MKARWAKPILLIVFCIAALLSVINMKAQASNLAQQPTGSLPTVTGTVSGPMAMVIPNGSETQANLRSGPGRFFDPVGVLSMGQKVPVLGKSPKGEWVQVEYPGAPENKAWVYANLVKIEPLNALLPVVESPPTPTPPSVATLDPTLAAKFVVTNVPTRFPTFTAPPPLAIPTYINETTPAVGGVPMGFVILGLAVLGLFMGLVAFSQR